MLIIHNYWTKAGTSHITSRQVKFVLCMFIEKVELCYFIVFIGIRYFQLLEWNLLLLFWFLIIDNLVWSSAYVFCLCIYLCVCLCIYLPVFISIYLLIYLSICLSTYLPYMYVRSHYMWWIRYIQPPRPLVQHHHLTPWDWGSSAGQWLMGRLRQGSRTWQLENPNLPLKDVSLRGYERGI